MTFCLRPNSFAAYCLASLLISTPAVHAQHAPAGKLQIYFVDVEGGQATLFITPSGKSLLIDTGWPEHGGRDADRIAAVVKDAGLKRIDFLLITHYHDDHVGGVPQLVARVPVGTFIDHGPNRETDNVGTAKNYAAYQRILAGGNYRHITASPGDVLPIDTVTAGLKITVVSADGNVLKTPLLGGGAPNAFCSGAETTPADQTENARSLGIQLTFGSLKILDLGDLTRDKEAQLVCPGNLLGTQDIYIVSHHGWLQSSSPAMVDALHARVAIMDNGETKGGSIPVIDTVMKAPCLENLWQLHTSAEGGATHNTALAYIANPPGTDFGYYLKLTGQSDGSFSVFNSRTAEIKAYPVSSGRK